MAERESNRQPTRVLPPRQIVTPETQFEFDESKIPPDMAYGWKRCSLAGMEDRRNMILMEQNGWRPVPAGRHRELSGSRAHEDESIVVGGQMLMELPKQYYQESQELDKFKARNTIEQNIMRLGQQKRQFAGQAGAERLGIRREGRGGPSRGEIIE